MRACVCVRVQVVNCYYDEIGENIFKVRYEKSAKQKGGHLVFSIAIVSYDCVCVC